MRRRLSYGTREFAEALVLGASVFALLLALSKVMGWFPL